MNTAYIQAVATIRALEARLLSDQGMEQLAGTANFITAVSEVKNKIYGSPAERMQYLPEALNTIDQEEKYLFVCTARLVFDPKLADLISWYGRLTEIKGTIKNTLNSQEQVPAEIKTWPEYIKQSWQQAQKEYAVTKDLKIVDFIVDAYYLQALHGALAQIHSPWLDELCLLAIDLYNLKTWLRFKINKISPKHTAALFLSGGEIDRHTFLRSADMTADDFIQVLRYKPYASALTAAWLQAKQNNDWLILDLFFTNYIIKFLRSAKLIYDGPEPVMAYLIVRLAELNNIKVILSGKFYNIPKDLITSRLSKAYA